MHDDDRVIIRLNKIHYSTKEIIELLETSKTSFHRELRHYRYIMHQRGSRWTVWEVKSLLEKLHPHFMIIISRSE